MYESSGSPDIGGMYGTSSDGSGGIYGSPSDGNGGMNGVPVVCNGGGMYGNSGIEDGNVDGSKGGGGRVVAFAGTVDRQRSMSCQTLLLAGRIRPSLSVGCVGGGYSYVSFDE